MLPAPVRLGAKTNEQGFPREMTEEIETAQLSKADVERLLSDTSAEARIATSTKIASKYDSAALNQEERLIAEDIFRVLVQDVEVRVRQALSAHLKNSNLVPRDVALSLARDVEAVALPVLKVSEVLTDDDLISIVRSQNAAKQSAIAQRPQVSSQVSDALVDTGNEDAVARLVRNTGAEISEAAYGRVMDHYEGSDAVTQSLVRRPDLPPAVSERVVAAISDALHRYLVSKQEVSPDVASDLVLQVRERAIMSLLDYGSSEAELDHLVDQLHHKGELTPSLLLRALCVGDMSFFERGIAKLTRLPLANVRLLIHDKGQLGLESLYLRARLPKTLFPAFRAAIVLAIETDYDGGKNDRERYVERMLERVLTRFPDPSTRLSPSDLEFLITKLRQLAA